MLNSEQIEHALFEAGLHLVVKNVHAHGYGSQGRPPIIFVKVRSTRAGPAAMDRAPLVIHPHYAGALDGIEGVEAAEGSYFNPNLKGFPRAVNKGQQRTAFGQAFDV
jgi:hypothetical protein